ncbi:carboxypeptidase regulatory-like domain-containing protein [Mucilaginibacter daejeonensis]|uniref:carboxypeptidase-like regulatory domain-containing protein n=1 Tax=Mucilaginibacter daejeonensis TaxID=398049 RepID=UPI001D1779A4|nr:carboxypeptidase-like regulatory domain-containing protein [Mucilaginibacter daejeonensis]UEG54509.1 carboxypeptidase regulatory-like domain-containing protein [Mucilaginibacter daejeonensis]
MIYRYTVALLLSVIFGSTAFAQRDSVSLNSIIEKTSNLAKTRPVEKVYLHFDKPYYAVDDTIWFKAYVTDNFKQPSQLSKVVYVELMNSRDSLTKLLKLPVRNGVAYGSFPLPELNYRQDNYHLRAYTKWMSNFDTDYFFSKTITVGSAIDKEVNVNITSSKTGADKQLQITSRIVYKDVDGVPQAGKKVSWTVSTISDDIAKGRGTTDASGALTISFTNSKQADLTGANINAVIDLGNKKSVGRSFPLRSVLGNTDVQFFPEGGELLAGVRQKIAIKAVASSGLGMAYTGSVVDNAGAEIAKLTSQNAGMSLFVLTAEAGKTYKANLTFANGTKGSYDLPKAQTSGFNISVSNIDPQNLNIKMLASPAFFEANKGRSFYIMAQSVGTVCFAAQTALREQVYSANIPASKFPTGVVQFTLFSSAGLPLSERLVFVNRNDALNLTLASDKPSYGVRQKVKLNVTAKSKGAPVDGDLSVAVIDESKVPVDENNETTILSSLLLTSDLKGYIEKPNYYFVKPSDKTNADLDLLMLTQGYRRFSYTQVLAGQLPAIESLPEQGIEISGTLRTTNGMPFKGGNVRLLIPDKYFSANAISDPEGRFKFTNLVFPDSMKVVATAKNNYNSRNLMLMMDGDKYPKIDKNKLYPDEVANIDSTLRPYLLNSKKQFGAMHVLKEVIVKAQKPSLTVDHSKYPALTGLSNIPDHMMAADRFSACANLFMCFQGQLMGVTYDQGNFYVSRDYNQGRKVPMALFVGGMPVDVNYLNSLTAKDIESVEIFLKDELGLINNANQTNGVLVVNTKTPPKGNKISLAELQDLLPQPSVAKLTPKGYDITREFYSPKYDVPKPVGQDLRSTIYWNPRVVTDKATGATSVEFYNADGKGNYRVVIEGFDKDGNVGRTVYRYKVQ